MLKISVLTFFIHRKQSIHELKLLRLKCLRSCDKAHRLHFTKNDANYTNNQSNNPKVWERLDRPQNGSFKMAVYCRLVRISYNINFRMANLMHVNFLVCLNPLSAKMFFYTWIFSKIPVKNQNNIIRQVEANTIVNSFKWKILRSACN